MCPPMGFGKNARTNLRARVRPYVGVTELFTMVMPLAGHLFAAARLARSTAALRASHEAPRSRRSFAQYSSRFLISRSKPRSGGS